MKRNLLIIVADLLLMPYIGGSAAYGEPAVTKIKVKGTCKDNYLIPNGPVTLNYDDLSKTFRVEVNENIQRVDVSIYKNGVLIFKDIDNGEADTTLNYEITDAEQGEYTATVATDGEAQVTESVDIEGEE